MIIWATVGMMLLAASEELLTLFLTLETMTICLYLSTAFEKTRRRSAEGGLKYFVYGSVSSALFLFGLSLVYGLTGTTQFEAIRLALGSATGMSKGLEGNMAGATALLLMLVGFGFKVAAVPFHQWAPDAYEGAPAPVTAWIATGSKFASFVALMKVFLHALQPWSHPSNELMGPGWLGVIALVSAITMTYGNFAALAQRNFKRMLAYSSIAHAGYMLVGVAAASASTRGRAGGGLGALLSVRLRVCQRRGVRRGGVAGARQENRQHRRSERSGSAVAAPGGVHPGAHALAHRYSPFRRLLRKALYVHGSAQPGSGGDAVDADGTGGAGALQLGGVGVLLRPGAQGDVPARAGDEAAGRGGQIDRGSDPDRHADGGGVRL